MSIERIEDNVFRLGENYMCIDYEDHAMTRNIFDNHVYENIFFDDIVDTIIKHWLVSNTRGELTEEKFIDYFRDEFSYQLENAIHEFCGEIWLDNEDFNEDEL